MRIPGEVTLMSSIKVVAISIIIVLLSISVAMAPTINGFEDYFINGIRYDKEIKLFLGTVSKGTHFRVFEKYFGRMDDRVLSWDLIDEMVSEMFSHDYPARDFTRTTNKVGFYGNDGVCLFKYFIRSSDPQKAFVWSTVVLNFVCFGVISVCYIIISIVSAKSSNKVKSSGNNAKARQRNRRMNRRISIIITTDFLCWVPFIIICMLHYFELLDATPWYSIFSMVILPINSVINPLLYNDIIMRNLEVFLSYIYTRVAGFTATLMSSVTPQHVTEHQDNIEMQEI